MSGHKKIKPFETISYRSIHEDTNQSVMVYIVYGSEVDLLYFFPHLKYVLKS